MSTAQKKHLLSPLRNFSTLIKIGVVISGLLQAVNVSAQQNSASQVKVSNADSPETKKGPDLVVADPVFDFGESKDKKVIQHIFILENVGDEPLVISDVSTSCGCTTAGEFQSEIPAGGKTELPVTFDPTSFGGDIHKLVIVRSNDPEKPETYLRIQGHIWQPVALTPDVMTFKISSTNRDLKKQSMSLINHLEQPLKPKIKKKSSDRVEVELKEIKEGKSYELQVQPVGPFENKTDHISVTIETGLEDPSELRAQIIVIYQPDILALPSKINVTDKKSKDGKHTVTILNRLNTTLKLTPKPFDIPGITMEIEEVHAGRLYKIHFKVSEDLSLPVDSDSLGTIQFETNNKELPVLNIEIEK